MSLDFKKALNKNHKKIKKKRSKLRDRFILLFITIATFPVLILSGISLYSIDLSHRNDVSNLELQVISQKQEEIEKFLADTLGILELRVGFTQRSDIELSQQLFILESLLEENPSFNEVSFIGLGGQETAKLTRLGSENKLNDVSKLPQFATAVNGEEYIGDVYYTIAGPATTFASPVLNRNGEIIQVLAAEVNLNTLVRSIRFTQFGSSGYVVLIDKNGKLIAHGGNAQKVAAGTSFAYSERIQRIKRGETLDALEREDRYIGLISQEPVVGAGEKISDLDWMILVEWPMSDVDAVIQDIRNQTVLLTLLIIGAVVALALLAANRLTQPIRKLKQATQSIEQGDFEKRVHITTNDEFEELGYAFNTMAVGLKRLQELKNEFVFIAAHELRTPVTAIRGYLSMIREEESKLSEDNRASLEVVWNSNERLVQLVNDILEIARSDAGQTKIEVAPCDMHKSIDAVMKEVKPLADEKHITLTSDTKDALPLVLADEGRVKEIVMNFVSNAIKYNNSENGYVKIWHEVSNDAVTVHVEDNGIGMEEEDRKRLFEKFFRIKSEETRGVEGTGLGLFITKELVEKMNGSVMVQSEKGKGSTFSFTLPRAKEHHV